LDKITAIILLVILIVILVALFRLLLPSVKKYIHRMPKGIFVLLFLTILGIAVYLVYFIAHDETGGLNGPENVAESDAEIQKTYDDGRPVTYKEHCVILWDDVILIENEKADRNTFEKYLDYRIENNITVTIVDDYASAAFLKEIKAVLEKKGARYIIEDEKWLE